MVSKQMKPGFASVQRQKHYTSSLSLSFRFLLIFLLLIIAHHPVYTELIG